MELIFEHGCEKTWKNPNVNLGHLLALPFRIVESRCMSPHTEGIPREQTLSTSALLAFGLPCRHPSLACRVCRKTTEAEVCSGYGETSLSLHEILPNNPTTYGWKTGENHGFAHLFHKFSSRIRGTTRFRRTLRLEDLTLQLQLGGFELLGDPNLRFPMDLSQFR